MPRRAALLALALSACTLANDPSRLAPAALDGVSGFCAAYARAQPDWLARCWNLDRAYMADQLHAFVATCNDMQRAWEAGRVVYRRDLAEACVAAWTYDGVCNRLSHGFEACSDVFAGAVPSGGTCHDRRDCASGTECVHPDHACPGTCAPPGTAGDPCGQGYGFDPVAAQCGGGYYCDAASSTCAPKKTAASSSSSCTTATECASGYLCAGPAGATTCQTVPGPGQPCDDTMGLTCTEHFACVAGSCLAAPALGPCLAGQCAAGSSCVADTCAVLPALGESCAFDVGCRDGQGYCSSTTRLCTAQPTRLPVAGEDCSAGRGCADGLYCDYGAPPFLCRPVPTSGGTCSPSIPCAGSDHCVAERCVPLKRAGEACTTGRGDCLPGLHCAVPDGCGDGSACSGALEGVCAGPAGPGADCGALPDGEVVPCRLLDSWCDLGASSFGTCQPYLASGRSCTIDHPEACGPALFASCQAPAGSTSGVCASTCREP